MTDRQHVRTRPRPHVGAPLALALLTCIALALIVVRSGPNDVRGSTQRPAATTPDRRSSSADCAALLATADLDWDIDVGRDPFGSDEMPTAPREDAATHDDVDRDARALITVGAIMLGSNPRALINGRVCQPGDVIQGFRIIEIQLHHVTVEKDGISVTLTL